jgi:simple sugar transport system permease protein
MVIETGLVASGLEGSWVRTVQGLVFLSAIIFYLFVEEPHRWRSLAGRFIAPAVSPPKKGGGEHPA